MIKTYTLILVSGLSILGTQLYSAAQKPFTHGEWLKQEFALKKKPCHMNPKELLEFYQHIEKMKATDQRKAPSLAQSGIDLVFGAITQEQRDQLFKDIDESEAAAKASSSAAAAASAAAANFSTTPPSSSSNASSSSKAAAK